METISITSKQGFSLSDINYALSRRWSVEGAGKDRLVIQEKGSRVYVYFDFSTEIENQFPKLMLDYSDLDLVKEVIRVIGNTPEFTIDNDFGTVLPGDQFVTRINSKRGWDWRSGH